MGIKGTALDFSEPVARFNHHYIGRIKKFGHLPCGAQKVIHQRALAGAEFDQGKSGRAVHCLPGGNAPDADEFTKHLADFGGRDEITAVSTALARTMTSRVL